MAIVEVNRDNIESEHICCAISEKSGEHCVSSKKTWLKNMFEDGLVFKKLDERGKVFIEYIPAENAWCPIDANGFMHINCFWVSGKFKGQGYANELLKECIEDAKSKGKSGLTILSSEKKMPFLSDPNHLKHKGFKVADSSGYFELFYLPFNENIVLPKFKDQVGRELEDKNGFVLYYTNQCPHTEKYAPIIKQIADEKNIPFSLIKYNKKEDAQNSYSPFTSYSLFYNGVFITNEILSENKFEKLLDEYAL